MLHPSLRPPTRCCQRGLRRPHLHPDAPSRPYASTAFKYLSFYKYTDIPHPHALQRQLLRDWSPLTLGRIYLATEGINAQLALPAVNLSDLEKSVHKLFPGVPLRAVDLHEQAFQKLHVRVRERIVADGLDERLSSLDLTRTGRAVQPDEWHSMVQAAGSAATLIDCRNQWEHEVGRFVGAEPLRTEQFHGSWAALDSLLRDAPASRPLLLYCTGGIRCEKVAAWLQQQRGFQDVRRLDGGINAYVQHVRQTGCDSLFVGKNYHFDQRVTERVSPHVLSRCHQCQAPADDITNCPCCNVLHIQCPSCALRLHHACSPQCASSAPGLTPAPFPAAARPRALPRRTYSTTTRPEPAPALTWREAERYCEQLSTRGSAAREGLARYTEEHHAGGAHMLAGPLVAGLLAQLVLATRARHVLELGTFTGYSALSMAEVLPPDTLVITCERSTARAAEARLQLQQRLSPQHARVEVRDGPALRTLEQLARTSHPPFDLVFLDADKRALEQYYEFILQHQMLSPHGLLVVDNVLQRGRVALPQSGEEQDARTMAVRQFNERVCGDARVRVVLLPVRDGISIISRRS